VISSFAAGAWEAFDSGCPVPTMSLPRSSTLLFFLLILAYLSIASIVCSIADGGMRNKPE
jgi:hypothetical protein